jgi:uncharacterized protein (DUF1778 family)
MGKIHYVEQATRGWAVRREGSNRATSVHETKADAIRAARERAGKSRGEIIVRSRDGQIQTRGSHGRYPASVSDGPPQSRSGSESSKTRVTTRIEESVHIILEEAAAYVGVPLNSFIVSAAVEKAGAILAADRNIKLSREDAEIFSRVLENRSGPNEALLRAAKKHREIIRG